MAIFRHALTRVPLSFIYLVAYIPNEVRSNGPLSAGA